jgi:protein transport protein SEC31
MSLLKQLDRAARTCWCPSGRYPNLLASGTIAGTIDDSFVTKSQLEIYDIDLGGPNHEMKLLGSIESKDCFHSVAWGAKGMEEGGGMSHGLVAGGMSDGSINIWNVDSILARAPSEQALLSRSEVHKGQVLGLQFHPSQPNLLASGATDGEVYVWDLANVKAPVPNKPNPAAKSAQMSGITSLAWNRSAPQILASSSELGETTVWDLRQKRSIITIRNSARMNVRASGLSWNPAAGVQLAVCYNNYPVAEIWSVQRNAASQRLVVVLVC